MMKNKTVVTITGIRPDFIRMSFVFKELDNNFNHILIHTGQHFDKNLSSVFFEQLGIREPDYILDTGKNCKNHFEQLAYLSTEIPKLFREKNINPDLILFLGDSNSAGVSFPLKKEGYKIGHIEAGMRSYDKRMLEEINRTVCDHCSNILFVYTQDYAEQLKLENINKNVFVVGNTIVEPFNLFKDEIMKNERKLDMILMDIHRPENFKYPHRLKNIFKFGNMCIEKYGLPVKLLYFKRLKDVIEEYGLEEYLGKIEMIELLPFKEYLETVYNCPFIISDSGTGQEEPALLGTPVLVPRDFTERPQSYESNCSFKLKVEEDQTNYDECFEWLDMMKSGNLKMETSWLGNGNTSKLIIQGIKKFFYETLEEKEGEREKSLINKINISNEKYTNTYPYPHSFQDNFLNPEFAKDIQREILDLPNNMWDRYENPFEQKFTLRDKYNFPPLLQLLFEKLTEKKFVDEFSKIVGHKLHLDSTRNFWGVHKYYNGDKLDIHVDAGYHPTLQLKKQVTLGIYLSDNWTEENGCELEIWSGDNCTKKDAQIYEKVNKIVPQFNRLVFFNCNDYSWHGNPDVTKGSGTRIFVTLSYLSENNEECNKRVKAFFIKRPEDPEDEEKDKFRELRADPEKYKEIYRM